MTDHIFTLNSTKNDLPISPSELVNRYFFGIPVIDQSGNIMSEQVLQTFIKSATQSIEGYLNVKMTKQIIEETLHYNLNDFKNWGYLPTNYPVLKPHSLVGFVGKTQQVEYPKQWLSAKTTNDPVGHHRSVYLVPTAGTPDSNGVVYSGITPHMGWFGMKTIPNYWTLTYCTSFNQQPQDIIDAIGKLAAINVFHQLGDIILGAGIASQSIGIDGVSQSISTTSSATNAGYGARITGYVNDLKQARIDLKNKYDGMVLLSC